MSAAPALLEVDGLHVRYPLRGGRVLHAVDDVTFTLARGETLGVVGESGSGKSSLARAIARLGPRPGGRIVLGGEMLHALEGAALRAARRRVQIVLQDARAALDPRLPARAAIEEPLRALRPELGRDARRARVAAILERVGLADATAGHRPAALSGGQCRRVVLARALAVDPELLVCDEPLSGLDVTSQAQVAELIAGLVRDLDLTVVLVAHDLALVRDLCDRVLVMYLGRAVEIAPAAELYARPRHPYTRALLAAVPVPDPHAVAPPPLAGEPPSPLAPPSGCAFRTRCPLAIERCAAERPRLRAIGASLVACHRADEGMPLSG
jgi:oligopeptide/dipeptide ABC transporter ATP-binding protein